MGNQLCVNNQPEIETDAEDMQALTWLVGQVRPGQWSDIARALKLIQEHGGYGKVILPIRDGRIGDHPKAELSL